MKIPQCARIAAMAVLATLVLSGTGWALVFPITAGPFTFCPDGQYEANFVEVPPDDEEITQGSAFGTGHCGAVNFTGSAGSAQDTWLTRYKTTVPGNDVFNAFNGICVEADILINKFNNAKGGGLVALLNTDPGDKGLFLRLINNGNTDRLTLNRIDPATGKITSLVKAGASSAPLPVEVPLGSGIVENAWYKLFLQVDARANEDLLTVRASVWSHETPSNPNSGLASQIGLLEHNTTLSDQGLEQAGFVGMAAWAQSALVNTSITNFLARTLSPPTLAPVITCGPNGV